MNYNLAFFTNDYTLIDNSQNLINKQLEFFTNLSTRNIARNFIANVMKYKNGNLMYNRFKTQYDFPETTDYNYYNLIFSDSSSNTIQKNWLNDSANESKINNFINKCRDLLNGVTINEPLHTEYLKIPLRVVGIDGYIRDGSGVLIDLSNNEILETFITGPYGFVNLTTPTYALPEFFKIIVSKGGFDITLLKISQSTLSNISSRGERLNLRDAISATPISTIKTKIIESEIEASGGQTINTDLLQSAKVITAKALNMNVDNLDKDYIVENDVNATKMVQKLQVAVNTLNENTPDSVNEDDIYESISSAIKLSVSDVVEEEETFDISGNNMDTIITETETNNNITIEH